MAPGLCGTYPEGSSTQGRWLEQAVPVLSSLQLWHFSSQSCNLQRGGATRRISLWPSSFIFTSADGISSLADGRPTVSLKSPKKNDQRTLLKLAAQIPK